MQTYTINQRGEVPAFITGIILKYNGMQANVDTFAQLDEDVAFLVNDCRECHGNTDKGEIVGGAWLCPKNNDNSWNVRIDLRQQ